MKHLFSLLFISLTFTLQAQDNGAVGGKILDAERYNEPLLMANVSLKNTDWTTQTNFNGNFEITDVAPGAYTMVVSFLGYDDVTMPIVISQNTTTYVQQSLEAKTMFPSDLAESASTLKK